MVIIPQHLQNFLQKKARLLSHLLMLTMTFCFVGCGASIPDSETEDVSPSTEFNQRDLEPMFARAADSLSESGVAQLWEAYHRQGQTTPLAILSVENQTTTPLDDRMLPLLTQLGEGLTDSGVKLVNLTHQPELLKQLKNSEGDAFDKSKIATLGVQFKVAYFLTGKLYSVTEPALKDAQPHHYLFLQVIDAQRGNVPWQFEFEVLR